MQISLSQLRDRFHEGLLTFLWRQWSQLGVAGGAEFSDRWAIDPEALLLVTLHMARYDPRLFDEVLDWCVQNGRWLSVQRLTNMSDRLENETARDILAVFAEFMGTQEASRRWGNLAAKSQSSAGGMQSLFLDRYGVGLPVLGEPEEVFANHGLVRSPLHLRGMSRPVRMDMPVGLIFKLRALFGLSSARPEVIAYLLTHSEGYPNEIARSVSYSPPSVQQTLADLADSGLVKAHESGRGRMYALDPSRWRQFLKLKPISPRWVDWGRAFAGLSMLRNFLMTEPFDHLSDYMLESRLRSLVEEIGPCFTDTGLEARPQALAEFRSNPKQFHTFVMRLLRALNPQPRTTRPS